MSEETDPIQEPVQHDRAYNEMMKLFEELTFKERVVKTFNGLNQPKDSGDYKFAKLQIQLMAGPILAVLIPVICIGFLLTLQSNVKSKDQTFAVEVIEPTEAPEIEAPPPEEQVEFEPLDTQFDGPVDKFNPQITDVANNEPLSPKPAEMNSVAIVKSPIVMRGIVGSRSPGQRGKALSAFGGSQAGEATVMRALRWLKSKQLENGAWPGQATAMTGMALLSFLAHGETPSPDCEEFGPTVEKGIRYLVDTQEANGLFKFRDGSNYAHPIAAYALCEAYTLTKVPMLKIAAEKALKHIVDGQHPSGGWDYNMRQTERDDTSYMGWCAQALKAAHMAGDLEVKNLDVAYKNAVNGFKKNALPSGGFGYTSPARGGLSGVGVLCMQLLGAAKENEVTATLAYLDECTYSFENWNKQPYGGGGAPVYYWYYITQAKFHAGGERWKSWNKQFQPELIKQQTVLKDVYTDQEGTLRDIGYWDSPSASEHSSAGGEKSMGKHFDKGVAVQAETSDGIRVQMTCLSALQLMVYYRYLPTFQTPQVAEEVETAVEDDDISIKITR